MKNLFDKLNDNFFLYIWFGLFFIGRAFYTYDDYDINNFSGIFEWLSLTIILGGVFALVSGAYLFGILIGLKNGYDFYKDKQYAYSCANFFFSFCLISPLIYIFIV